jgi:hypothetical protein
MAIVKQTKMANGNKRLSATKPVTKKNVKTTFGRKNKIFDVNVPNAIGSNYKVVGLLEFLNEFRSDAGAKFFISDIDISLYDDTRFTANLYALSSKGELTASESRYTLPKLDESEKDRDLLFRLYSQKKSGFFSVELLKAKAFCNKDGDFCIYASSLVYDFNAIPDLEILAEEIRKVGSVASSPVKKEEEEEEEKEDLDGPVGPVFVQK